MSENKKKIAVILTNMIIGGVEKVLVDFLNNVDHYNYEWFLFTDTPNSGFVTDLPSYVEIRDLNENVDLKNQFYSDLNKMKFVSIIKGIMYRFIIRYSNDDFKKQYYIERLKPKIKDNFDCAIAYKLNINEIAIILNRIKAKKKCAVLHGKVNRDYYDYSKKGKVSFFDSLEEINKIYCVSKDVEKNLHMVAPLLNNKTDVLHNFYNIHKIENLANDDIREILHSPYLLTVGRLDLIKGQMLIPEVQKILVQKGYLFNWYLIGDGPIRENVQQKIDEYHLGEYIEILGSKINPYPYIKNCFVYVQPSFSEGYCTTTIEAKILHKPIVVTDVSGMNEQFENRKNGIIISPITPENIAEGIISLLSNYELRESIVKNTFDEKINKFDELNKLYDFIENDITEEV